MRIPFILIQDIVLWKRERELAVFLKLKSLYVNSQFYHFTYERLSADSGISQSCLRKYIKLFLANGWCKFRRKKKGDKKMNLEFKDLITIADLEKLLPLAKRASYRKIAKGKKTELLKIRTDYNVRDIVVEIRLLILKKKKESFEFFKELRDLRKSNNPRPLLPWKQYKHKLKLCEKYSNVIESKKFEDGSEHQMTLYTIAKNIGKKSKPMSVATASRLMSLAELNGSIKKIVGDIHVIGPEVKKECLSKGQFNWNGLSCHRACNQYVFT